MDVGDCGVVDIVPGDCWVRGSNARGMGRAWDGGMGNASDGGLGNAAYVGTTDGCAGGDGNADGYCDTSAYGDALGHSYTPCYGYCNGSDDPGHSYTSGNSYAVGC